MSDKMPLIGRLAVHLKMITLDQLAQATRAQADAGGDSSLGEVLVGKGFISRAQLSKLVAAQKQVLLKQRARLGQRDGAPPPRAAAPRGAASPPQPAPPAPSEAEAPPAPAAPAVDPRPEGAPAAAAPASSSPPAAARPDVRATAPASATRELAEPGESDGRELLALLRAAVERGSSDLHLHAGAPPRVRVAGRLEPAGDALDAGRIERMLVSVLDAGQRERLASHGELDVCHTVEGLGRFRANLYRQQRGLDGVFRFIPAAPPTLAELSLPMSLARLTNYHQGLVLVTGPTGCGKSSTLAALVNLVNEERREHILTIEDPIEYVHASKRCLVNQRSVGRHTGSFARALRAALREDPDVIVIGELRDLETVSLALSAAETGHFVLATLHTDNAIRTVNRLVGSFPADQQDQVRAMLSESLRAVVSQRLLPRADGNGRVPACETLLVTRAVGNLIRENKTFQIHSILQTGASQGMALLDNSIRELVNKGVVSPEEAARHVEDGKAVAA